MLRPATLAPRPPHAVAMARIASGRGHPARVGARDLPLGAMTHLSIDGTYASRTLDEPLHSDTPSALSALQLLDLLWRWRRLIAVCTGGAALLAIAVILVLPRRYTATASFVPQSRRSMPGAGLAAQFGIAIPGSNPAESPQFYVELLKSRQVLGPTVEYRYEYNEDGKKVTTSLTDLYGKNGDSPVRKRSRAILRLRSDMSVSATPRTDVVTIEVTAKNALLVREIVDELLAEVNTFNVGKRQSQGSVERKFTEARLGEASADLRTAEGRLEQFLQSNRLFTTPRLEFERDRLQRDISMKQQIYTTLAQAYQQAKIEEVRDSPVITIIETPETPPLPDSRQLVQRTLIAIILGLLLSSTWIIGRQYLTLRRDTLHSPLIGSGPREG
jgi:uncharacterized protein involved in exopolysaccharide biosynthesis